MQGPYARDTQAKPAYIFTFPSIVVLVSSVSCHFAAAFLNFLPPFLSFSFPRVSSSPLVLLSFSESFPASFVLSLISSSSVVLFFSLSLASYKTEAVLSATQKAQNSLKKSYMLLTQCPITQDDYTRLLKMLCITGFVTKQDCNRGDNNF